MPEKVKLYIAETIPALEPDKTEWKPATRVASLRETLWPHDMMTTINDSMGLK